MASSQKDVHGKLNYERMYSVEEKAILQALLRHYVDAWRLRHPEVDNAFTVWDEKTSARVFNEACSCCFQLNCDQCTHTLMSVVHGGII